MMVAKEMAPFHALYLAGCVLLMLRVKGAAPSAVPGRSLLRHLLIAAGIGASASFLPPRSAVTGIVLVGAYLGGLFSLAVFLIQRTEHLVSALYLRLMLIFVLTLVAMFVMALPLFWMASIPRI
jgi:hypothetical protein